VSPQAYTQFIARLDEPLKANDRLRRTMQATPPWEQRVALSRPEPLSDTHELGEFSSGVDVLDDWLKRRARANQVSGASRTCVISD
jgi:hypothetical protein